MLSLVDTIKRNNIEQIVISSSLDDNKYTYFKNINLEESKYNNNKKSTLFWGVYNTTDIAKIYQHNGPIYIFWGGNDICAANKLRLKFIRKYLVKKKISCHYYSDNKCLINLNKYFPNNNFLNINNKINIVNNNINVVNNKQNLYFLCTEKNSGDYNTAFDFTKDINDYNSIITYINELPNIQFKSNDLIVFMDESLCRKININIFNKINCIKIAWVRNWERKWLEYLKLFDYVLCCTNKAKTFIESNGIKSYILPIGGNFNEYNFSQNCEYDILIDVNLKNKRKIINNIIGLVKINKYKIAIIGEGWDKYLSKDEFNLIKKYYKGSINCDEIKNYYLRSKLIIDDCNINTEEFGSVNKRVIDVISCKRLVITNNKVGNDEIFDNTLPYYDSFETLKNVITSYINDNKKYNNKVNQLYTYANKFINNDKYKHVFTNLPLFQKNNVEIDLVIKICGRDKVNFTFTDSYQWGDLFMAANIRNELFNLYGLNCQICLINDWYNYEIYNCNNVLFLRGISIYNPKPENNNMVLFISHPESYTDEEFKKYNKIICCSKVFYEKIKTNLKLNEDDIIFALQPIAIPDEVKTDKERDILYDAIFIGNKMRERESISWLTEDNLNKVKIFGNMWENENIKPVIQNIKFINNKEVIELYFKSKIILIDTWKDMRENGFINNRVLEGLISNNYVLTDNVNGLEDFNFNNLTIYKDNNQLNDYFNLLLKKELSQNQINLNILKQNNSKIHNFIASNVNINEKTVYYLNKNHSGGSWHFSENLFFHINRCNEYIKFKQISDKNDLNSICSKDVIFIQYFFDYKIKIEDILSVKNKTNCKLIISLHDFVWVDNPYIHDHPEKAHLKENIKINEDVINLFDSANFIVSPSKYVTNEYRKFFKNCNIVNIPRFDYKINYDNVHYKPIKDELNIGVIHRICIYKGKEYYDFFKKIKHVKFNDRLIKINLIPITYNYFDVFKRLDNIHCLTFFNYYPETYNQALSKGIMTGLPIIFNSIGAATERMLDDNNNPLQERFFEVKQCSGKAIIDQLYNVIEFLHFKKPIKSLDIKPDIIFHNDWLKIFKEKKPIVKEKKYNKIAICLYGLYRDESWYESFKKNILDVLTSNGIEYDIYIHTYYNVKLNLKRSNEFGTLKTNIENDIKCKYIIKEDHELILNKNKDLFESAKKYGDAFNNDFESVKNLLLQLNSLKKVTSLWVNESKYDQYFYVRLDTLFHDKIDIDFISKYSNNKTLFTCNWLASFGINDRFSIGDYNVMKIYGNRINYIFDYMNYNKEKRPLHSEKLVNFICYKYNIINIELENFKFSRIRLNGVLKNEPWHLSHKNTFLLPSLID